MKMKLGLAALVAVGPLAQTLLAASPASHPEQADPRINEIQVVGTHNSYALPADPRVMAMMAPRVAALREAMNARLTADQRKALAEEHPSGLDDLRETLDYVQMPIEAQLRMGVRSLEIDLHPDPQGGLYADPLPHREWREQGHTDALAPIYEAALRKPGMKVLHVADVDFRSQCPALTDCLRLMRQWSDANPGHSPVFVLLEPKLSGLDKAITGATRIPPFDAAAFAEIDQALRTIIGEDRLFTPDQLRGSHPTLEAAALAKAWPRLSETRGKFVFLYLVPGLNFGAFDPYLAGHTNLEGRAAFVQGMPGMAHTAFVMLDNAVVNAGRIRQLVRAGYMVRSRADIDTGEARANDSRRRDITLASGAQIISTDYLTAPNIFGNEYHVAPWVQGWRCNPLNTHCASNRAPKAKEN